MKNSQKDGPESPSARNNSQSYGKGDRELRLPRQVQAKSSLTGLFLHFLDPSRPTARQTTQPTRPQKYILASPQTYRIPRLAMLREQSKRGPPYHSDKRLRPEPNRQRRLLKPPYKQPTYDRQKETHDCTNKTPSLSSPHLQTIKERKKTKQIHHQNHLQGSEMHI